MPNSGSRVQEGPLQSLRIEHLLFCIAVGRIISKCLS